MKALAALATGLLLWLSVAQAQRDFLTPDEVAKVRLTQEPDARLALYASFAELRIELLRNYFANEKAGRSALIHDVLEDYTKIIEAIDTVADDALRRNLPIDTGVAAVEAAERKMLADLERFDEMETADRSRYDFVLQDALDATRDSLALAEEDIRDRKIDVAKRDTEDRKEREAMMTPEDVKASRDQAKQNEQKKGRKLPSLKRAGDEDPAAAPKKK